MVSPCGRGEATGVSHGEQVRPSLSTYIHALQGLARITDATMHSDSCLDIEGAKSVLLL